MKIRKRSALVLVMSFATSIVFTQSQAQPPLAGPTFEVVSIKRNMSNALGQNGSNERPDGGFTWLNGPVGVLISRAYPPGVPADIIGLPGWAMSERYDVRATSSLTIATADQRMAMLRAMLVDRFKLVTHLENREQPVYDLVLARSDGRLGPAIKPSEVDCVAKLAAERAARESARAAGPSPPPPGVFNPGAPTPECTLRMNGDSMEGDITMENLARMLRPMAGRYIVDKTGLMGSYRLTLNFDRMAGRRGPDTAPPPGAAPSVFTAVQEQLGLKLESSRATRETLVVDRLERPTED